MEDVDMTMLACYFLNIPTLEEINQADLASATQYLYSFYLYDRIFIENHTVSSIPRSYKTCVLTACVYVYLQQLGQLPMKFYAKFTKFSTSTFQNHTNWEH